MIARRSVARRPLRLAGLPSRDLSRKGLAKLPSTHQVRSRDIAFRGLYGAPEAPGIPWGDKTKFMNILDDFV